MTNPNEKLTPKQALIKWSLEHNQTPATFSKAVGYSYVYSWQLLRGTAHVTFETLGRLVVTFGAESVNGIIAAMREWINTGV
jgi:hypothetical protein